MAEPSSEDQNQKGWSFQRSGESSGPEDDEPSLIERYVPEWLRKNATTVTSMTLVILLYFGFIALKPSGAPDPTYDVPGGDVQEITENQVIEWTIITKRIANRIKAGESPSVHGTTLFAYFGELQDRKALRDAAKEICDDEGMNVSVYRNTTHEIALTYPFREMDTLEYQLNNSNEPASDGEMSPRNRKIKKNREVVNQHLEEVKRAWQTLRDATPEEDESS